MLQIVSTERVAPEQYKERSTNSSNATGAKDLAISFHFVF